MKIPSRFSKGDSLSWDDTATIDRQRRAITSSDWVLGYAIRGAQNLDLTASSNGTGWRTEITAVQSATLEPGKFYWQAFASKGSERITLGTGSFLVDPDLTAASTGFDGRSQVEKDLEAVQAAMRSMISGGAVSAYTIGNRQVQKMQMADLIALESKLKYQLTREKRAQAIANGLGDPLNVKVRF